MSVNMNQKFIDSLVPPELSGDVATKNRVRMFLISHLIGPVLGLPIPFLLWYIDPAPFPHVHIMVASVSAFWVMPLVLRMFPSSYAVLAHLSVLNLNAVVLWGAYNYGGASSPFLLWYVLIPLLASFYLGTTMKHAVLFSAQFLAGLGIFTAAYFLGGTFPVHVPAETMVIPGILSAFCATAYAFIMAVYYSRIVDSQSGMMREIDSHRATMAELTVARDEAEEAKRLAEKRNEELVVAKEKFEHGALHDALTGLPNRRYLDNELAAIAGTDVSVAVLHVDLDRFKQINDTLGHAAGDAMLQHAARILGTIPEKGDFLARVGGDEFIIVLKSLTDRRKLLHKAEQAIDLIRQPVPYENHTCRFGASIGIAVQQAGETCPKRLLIDADIALYKAKDEGRNRAVFFSEEMQADIVRNKQVADDVLRALEEGEFCAYYQPQVCAATRQIVGVEALVRWNHPDKGVLAPGAFAKVAEDIGVLHVIDQIVLEQALADMDRWKAAGVEIPKVSVNVSARRLSDRDLIFSLQKLRFARGTLAFELVESIFLDEADDVVANNIRDIKELGISVEIDDFGTGHASIVGLLNLEPSVLKIDRQFITPLTESEDRANLVGSIIDLGKSLGIAVTAEGVETAEQADRLRDLGCDVLQGYHFAKPMDPERIMEFAAGWKPLKLVA